MRISPTGFLATSLFLFLPALPSCEGEKGYVDPDRIYTIYEIIYHSEKQQTLISAGFRLLAAEGEPVELTGTSRVTFNDAPIPFDKRSGTHRMEIPGAVHSGTFLYTDFDGNSFTTETPFLPSIQVPDIQVFSSSVDHVIAWKGDPVGEGEIVLLRIEGATGFLEKLSSQPGDTAFFVSGPEIRQVDLFGSGVLTVRRIHSHYLSLGTATGGELTMRHTDSSFIEFKD